MGVILADEIGQIGYLTWPNGSRVARVNEGQRSRERSDWSDAVARQIASERAFRRMTQAQVYEPAGMSKATYMRLEAGARVADVSQLARICEALGLTLVEFVRRVEARMAEGEHQTQAPAPGAVAFTVPPGSPQRVSSGHDKAKDRGTV